MRDFKLHKKIKKQTFIYLDTIGEVIIFEQQFLINTNSRSNYFISINGKL